MCRPAAFAPPITLKPPARVEAAGGFNSYSKTRVSQLLVQQVY